jgi:carbamoyl-phosphate synthase large subunit
VLPLIDPDIPLLALNKPAIALTGARLAVVDKPQADICRDKWLTYEFFRQTGVPTPESWLPETRLWEPGGVELPFPLFVRPRRGSAGADAFKVNNRSELDFFCQYVPDPIIQRFISGPEITSDVICDFDGNVVAVVSRQRIAVRGGEVMKSITIRNDDVTEHCCQIAVKLKAVGPITVQCMLHDGTPRFTEINGRLGGGVPLAIAAGVDIPALLVAAAMNRPIDWKVTDKYTTGLYMSRCDQSFFVTETQLDEISSDYLRP